MDGKKNVISAFKVPNVYLGKTENKGQTKPMYILINVMVCWKSAIQVKGKMPWQKIKGETIFIEILGHIQTESFRNQVDLAMWIMEVAAFLAEVGKAAGSHCGLYTMELQMIILAVLWRKDYRRARKDEWSDQENSEFMPISSGVFHCYWQQPACHFIPNEPIFNGLCFLKNPKPWTHTISSLSHSSTVIMQYNPILVGKLRVEQKSIFTLNGYLEVQVMYR